jgi:hypothetical protein
MQQNSGSIEADTVPQLLGNRQFYIEVYFIQTPKFSMRWFFRLWSSGSTCRQISTFQRNMLLQSSAQMMEAARSSETSATAYTTIRCDNPETTRQKVCFCQLFYARFRSQVYITSVKAYLNLKKEVGNIGLSISGYEAGLPNRIICLFISLNIDYLSHGSCLLFCLILHLLRSRCSAVGIVTSYGLDDWGLGVRVPAGWRIFSSPNRPDRLWGPLQTPVQWVPGVVSLSVKRQGREADHSPPASAEVKKMWIYTSTPPYVFMA